MLLQFRHWYYLSIFWSWCHIYCSYKIINIVFHFSFVGIIFWEQNEKPSFYFHFTYGWSIEDKWIHWWKAMSKNFLFCILFLFRIYYNLPASVYSWNWSYVISEMKQHKALSRFVFWGNVDEPHVKKKIVKGISQFSACATAPQSLYRHFVVKCQTEVHLLENVSCQMRQLAYTKSICYLFT